MEIVKVQLKDGRWKKTTRNIMQLLAKHKAIKSYQYEK